MDNDTEYERTKEYLKGKLPMYLRSKNINLNAGFNCLNPQHQDHEHSMHYEKQSHTVNCSRCNARYDIFDVVGMDYNLDSFDQRFNKVHEMYIGPVPDSLNKDTNHTTFGKSAGAQFQDRFQQPIMTPNQDRRLIVPNARMDMQHNHLDASALDRLEAQRKNSRQGNGLNNSLSNGFNNGNGNGRGNARPQTGINAQRQYSTSFGPQSQASTVQRTINLNPNGTVASVQTHEVSGKGLNKPQPRFQKPRIDPKESVMAGITTISLSREEAEQLSASGVSRLGQLPASLANSIRASDQAKRQQMQAQAQERKRMQEINEGAFGKDHLGERLEPTFKIPQDLELAAEGSAFKPISTKGTEPSFGDGTIERLEATQEHATSSSKLHASVRANLKNDNDVVNSVGDSTGNIDSSFGNAGMDDELNGLSPIQALARGRSQSQITARKSIHPQIQEVSSSDLQANQANNFDARRGSKLSSGMSSGRGVADDNAPSNDNRANAFENSRAFQALPPFVTKGTPKFKTDEPFSSKGLSTDQGNDRRMNAPGPDWAGNGGAGATGAAGVAGSTSVADTLGNASGTLGSKVGKGTPNFFASAQASSAAQATGTSPSLSSQVNKRYDELWADFDKAHLEKQQAAAKAAAENEQRRQREEEYSQSLRQFQYQRPNQTATPVTSSVSEDEDSPYLSPNQNIQEFEKAKAQRHALSQQAAQDNGQRPASWSSPNAWGNGSDYSEMDDGTVTGNVTSNDDPQDHRAIGTRSQDNQVASDGNPRQATGHASSFNSPQPTTYAFGHNRGRNGMAETTLDERANAGSAVGASAGAGMGTNSSGNSRGGDTLSPEMANSPIAGMMEQLNGTSNGSMSNGNSRQGKATSAIFNTATASQSWKQVFGDAELPLLNPTAPSTLINGRSYNFEQMDEKTLRNHIEQNLASDTARIVAENARTPHSLYESAKGRPEQPSTHIFGSAVDGKPAEPQINTSRPSSGDPYTVGSSLSAMVSASMAAQRAGASTAGTAITGAASSAGAAGATAMVGSLSGGANAVGGRDDEISTVIQRTPVSGQRTPSGALVGATAEVHSTPSIAEQIKKELSKKSRINEQNTRIFGTLNKVEEPPEEEINTRISVSNRHTPPMQDKLPPLDTSNPYSTTILSGVMKDKLMPKRADTSSVSGNGNAPAKKVHRGPKIDFSNIQPLSQDSTVTTSTSHSAQIDFTQLERERVSTLNAQINKTVEKVSTPLSFFARAQDAIDDPELKNKAVLVDEYGEPTNLDSKQDLQDGQKESKSKLSPEKLKEFAQLATLPSLEEKTSEGDALDRLAKVTQQASDSSKKLESTEDLNEALAKSAAAISAAATIKAAYVSLDKDLEKLGLKDDNAKTADTKSSSHKLISTAELTGDAVKEFKISLDSIDSFLDSNVLKSGHGSGSSGALSSSSVDAKHASLEELSKLDSLTSNETNKGAERVVKDDFKVKPEDKLPPMHLSPEEKDRALKMGIELLQAQDLLKDPSLLPPNTRVISGNKGHKVGREQDALDIIQELLSNQKSDTAAASTASQDNAGNTGATNTADANAKAKAVDGAQAKAADATESAAKIADATAKTQDSADAPISAQPQTQNTPAQTVTGSNAAGGSQAGTANSTQSTVGMSTGAGTVTGTVATSAILPQGNLAQLMAAQPLDPNALATPGLSPNIASTPLAGLPGLTGLPAMQPVPPMQPVSPMQTATVHLMPPMQAVVPLQNMPMGASAAQPNVQTAGQMATPSAQPMSGPAQVAPTGNGVGAGNAVTNANAGAIDFWCKTKGLSLEVVERFNLSYLPQLPVGTQVWSAAIIPLNDDCQQVLNTQTGQSMFMGCNVPCFNLNVLPEGSEGLANALFIVSSPLDALSLESLGAHAIALTQTDNANSLLEYLQENLQQTQPFYIALERSSQWAEVAQRLCWGFNALQQPFKLIDLSAPYASINQALLQDKSGLLSKLQNPEVLNSLVIALPQDANAQGAPGTQGAPGAMNAQESLANAPANQFTPIQLLEVFAPMKDSGFILSTESLAKLQLANVLYTVTTTNVAISRLILSSIMLNQAPILFAGSKMQWQMLCNRLATLPVGGVLSANNNNTVVVGTPESTDLASGIAPQPCNARLVELPLEFDTKSLLITLTQAVMTARNSLPNFGALRLMLDTYSFEERFCAALAPLLAELALSLNLPIMVWCTSEQRRYFEGQSVQTIEITKGMDNEVIFKTLDQDCHLHTFRSLPR